MPTYWIDYLASIAAAAFVPILTVLMLFASTRVLTNGPAGAEFADWLETPCRRLPCAGLPVLALMAPNGAAIHGAWILWAMGVWFGLLGILFVASYRAEETERARREAARVYDAEEAEYHAER